MNSVSVFLSDGGRSGVWYRCAVVRKSKNSYRKTFIMIVLSLLRRKEEGWREGKGRRVDKVTSCSKLNFMKLHFYCRDLLFSISTI